MLGELQAVVGGDGLYKVVLLEAFEDADDLFGSFSSGWVLKLPEPYFPGLPVNDFRSFGDVNPVGDCTPPLSQGSALLVPPAMKCGFFGPLSLETRIGGVCIGLRAPCTGCV